MAEESNDEADPAANHTLTPIGRDDSDTRRDKRRIVQIFLARITETPLSGAPLSTPVPTGMSFSNPPNHAFSGSC